MCGPGLTIITIHYHTRHLKPCHYSLVGNWQADVFVTVRQEQVQALLVLSANYCGVNRSQTVRVCVSRRMDAASKP